MDIHQKAWTHMELLICHFKLFEGTILNLFIEYKS